MPPHARGMPRSTSGIENNVSSAAMRRSQTAARTTPPPTHALLVPSPTAGLEGGSGAGPSTAPAPSTFNRRFEGRYALITASTAGIAAPISTTNGACSTPRLGKGERGAICA